MITEASLRQTRAYSCLDCGKCTAACPIARHDADFSPRLLVYSRVSGQSECEGADPKLVQCLTCGLCTRLCPSNVDYLGFTRLSRVEEHAKGEAIYPCSHGGAMESMQRLMARDGKAQRRLGWVPADMPRPEQGELLYFAGCLPYFDAYFTHLNSDCVEIARGSLKLMAGLDEPPVLLPDERCCGHDLYWSGDRETAAALAAKNAAAIRASGAKRVVASCPECAHMLRDIYPTLNASLDAEVLHLSEYLAEKLATGELTFKRLPGVASFHDSCRLGRQLKAGGAARSLLEAIYGSGFRELKRHGEDAPCCGTSGWLRCDAVSRKLQNERLRESVEAGAETLVTACPKCRLHFRCAQTGGNDDDLNSLAVRDLATVAAEAMAGGENSW